MVDGEVPREEKMLESGTDPESYIIEYTVAYEGNARASCIERRGGFFALEPRN